MTRIISRRLADCTTTALPLMREAFVHQVGMFQLILNSDCFLISLVEEV